MKTILVVDDDEPIRLLLRRSCRTRAIMSSRPPMPGTP